MIARFEVHGFKRFSDIAFTFAPLTVLTRQMNGAGKTSALQALLLAREACLPNARSVSLNGPFGLELGTAQDVLNIHTAVDTSSIRFKATLGDGTVLTVALGADNEKLLNLPSRTGPPILSPGRSALHPEGSPTSARSGSDRRTSWG